MRKPIFPVLLLIIIVLLAAVALRSYKQAADQNLAAHLAASERSEADQKRDEADKRANALAEANRLAKLDAQRNAQEAARKDALATKRQEQAAQAIADANAKAGQIAKLLAELKQTRADAESQARQLEAERQKADVERNQAVAQALGEIARLNRQNHLISEENTKLQAEIKASQPATSVWKPGPVLPRDVQPSDYKRRAHDYQENFIANSASQTPPAPSQNTK